MGGQWLKGLSKIATNIYLYKGYRITRVRPKGYNYKCTFCVSQTDYNTRDDGIMFDSINKAKQYIESITL